MLREVFVDEDVRVLWRVLASGAIRPTSFIWRDKTRYVDQLGRTWEERTEGKTVRCYMIHAVDGETFELRWDPAADVWQVHRAWIKQAYV